MLQHCFVVQSETYLSHLCAQPHMTCPRDLAYWTHPMRPISLGPPRVPHTMHGLRSTLRTPLYTAYCALLLGCHMRCRAVDGQPSLLGFARPVTVPSHACAFVLSLGLRRGALVSVDAGF